MSRSYETMAIIKTEKRTFKMNISCHPSCENYEEPDKAGLKIDLSKLPKNTKYLIFTSN
jgi:uncharacterized protein involved in tolerance to divalent cations